MTAHKPGWRRRRKVHADVHGVLPFGSHSEYATGEERILIRGWLHLAAGVGIFLLLFTNWDWILTLPVQLQLLLVTNCVKGTVSGTLHVLVPPHAPLLLLFVVHFIDIVVIVLAMCASGLAFQDTSDWSPLLTMAAVGSVLVGLCEAPLWPLKLMRPPGKEHFSVKIRYAVMLLIALYAQWILYHELHPTGGVGSANYWIQFSLYVFGFHSTATRPERAWHRKGFYEAHDDLHTVSVIADIMIVCMAFQRWHVPLLD